MFLLGKFQDPAFEKEIRAYVKNHHLTDQVHFTGFAKVEDYISHAAVHLMPSCVEGYPMTLMEAKSYGVPTVAYSLPYLEAGKEEYGTVMVPQQDYRSMAEKVSELLEDPGKLNELARKAYDSLQWFDNARVFSRWRALFQWLETGVEPAELAVPELPDSEKLELLKIQTEGIISGISSMNVSPVYRKKILNEIHTEKRHENLLFDLVMRFYFALRKKAGNRLIFLAVKSCLNGIWCMKRIYRWFRPWRDEEQDL